MTEIPIRNLWLLFLYAADLLVLRERCAAAAEQARDLPQLLAAILCHVVDERIRRNLNRGYRPVTRSLPRVRGRIDLLQTEVGRTLEKGQVVCRYDEHTVDTPRNQLVRAALERQSAHVHDEVTSARCRRLAGLLGRQGVTLRRPSRAEMSRDQLSRNDVDDRLMVLVAEMVFSGDIPLDSSAGEGFLAYAIGDALLRRLFETAIGNALRIAGKPLGWTVRQGTRLRWPVTIQTAGMKAILPGMQTDIVLEHGASGRRVVIDTKFARIFTASQYRASILKSGYLYQLYTYLRTQESPLDPMSMTADGVLLHPQVGEAVDESMVVQGHRIRCATLNLCEPPAEFEKSLGVLLDSILLSQA